MGGSSVQRSPSRLNFQKAINLANNANKKKKSGAIVEYLIETYDTKSALSYPKSNLREATQCRTWSYFQCSGQGPYFGQMGWFAHHHPGEKIPSVLERYTNEILRVNGVIDLHLGKQGTGYLVGDKCTYADLMFVPYVRALAIIIAPEIDTTGHKRYTQWVERLYARPAVKKVLEMWDEAITLTREEAH